MDYCSWKWFQILVHLVIIALLGGMIGYVADVMSERKFYERVIERDIVCRPDDTGRICESEEPRAFRM